MAANERGLSLVEMTVTCGLVGLLAAFSVPSFRGYQRRAHIAGAARVFSGEFRKAHSMAVRSGVYTALRFEPTDDGIDFSVYADGNHNGVLSADIAKGIDRRIAGPLPLHGNAPGVTVALLPGIPALPPDTGKLKGEDPIRFGKTDILSFSPLGTSTPGTFYLAGDGVQGAVRVTNNARVRLLLWGGGRWQEY